MTDKQFEQIEYLSKKLWGDINNGHEYSMVTYTEFLGIVTEVWEGLQEEPASDDLEAAADKFVKSYTKGGTKQSWLKEGYIAGAMRQKTKDESITKDLGEYISELSKQFPEVSFAKLSRIAVRVAKWQMAQMIKDATDMVVGYWMPNGLMLTVDETENCYNIDEGDRVKVIVIKED